MMCEALEGLRDALTRRGLSEAYHLNESIDEILYPLGEIDAFFEAIKTGAVDQVLPLDQIASAIERLCSGERTSSPDSPDVMSGE